MNAINKFPQLVLLVFVLHASFDGGARQSSNTPIGIFEGSTPCGEMPRAFLRVPVKDSCEFIRWHFTFYQSSITNQPSTFTMKAVFGLTQPNTQGFSKSSQQLAEGKWMIRKGIQGNPNADVYELITTNNDTLSFLQLNRDMLHPLDPLGRLMIGNAGWSYALSRTDNGVKK